MENTKLAGGCNPANIPESRILPGYRTLEPKEYPRCGDRYKTRLMHQWANQEESSVRKAGEFHFITHIRKIEAAPQTIVEKIKGLLKNSRPLTSEERSSLNEFFWTLFEVDKPAAEPQTLEKPTVVNLIPRDEHDQWRRAEISNAINKKVLDYEPIPQEWIDELSGLNARLKP